MNYLDVARMMKLARDFYAEELAREEQADAAEEQAILAQARAQGIQLGDNYTINRSGNSVSVNGQPVSMPQGQPRVVQTSSYYLAPDDPRFAEMQARMDAARNKQLQAQRNANTRIVQPTAPAAKPITTAAKPITPAPTTAPVAKPAVQATKPTTVPAKPPVAQPIKPNTATTARPAVRPNTPIKPGTPVQQGQRLSTTTRPSPGPRR